MIPVSNIWLFAHCMEKNKLVPFLGNGANALGKLFCHCQCLDRAAGSPSNLMWFLQVFFAVIASAILLGTLQRLLSKSPRIRLPGTRGRTGLTEFCLASIIRIGRLFGSTKSPTTVNGSSRRHDSPAEKKSCSLLRPTIEVSALACDITVQRGRPVNVMYSITSSKQIVWTSQSSKF